MFLFIESHWTPYAYNMSEKFYNTRINSFEFYNEYRGFCFLVHRKSRTTLTHRLHPRFRTQELMKKYEKSDPV